MFHKKHTVKEAQTVGKSENKKMKAKLVAMVGQEFEDVVDAVWDKKGTTSRQRWQFGHGVSASLLLVNELPLLITVDLLPRETEEFLPKRFCEGAVMPTIFFFLRARFFLSDAPERFASLLPTIGTKVFCRGPTSRFLLHGSHLMIPGVLAADTTKLTAGSFALVLSVGTDAPYAIGLATTNLSNGESNGVGVYVVNCYEDSLWKEFEATFVASCSDKSADHPVNPLPAEFQVAEVLENLPAVSAAPTNNDEAYVPVAHEETSLPPAEAASRPATEADGSSNVENLADVPVAEAPVANFSSLFAEEEDVLRFALCETVKGVSDLMLPLPLAQFTALMTNAYPRVNEESKPINFKSTKHKQAIAFLKQFDDVIELSKMSEGVYAVTGIVRSSDLLRDHNRKYREFLAEVQRPAKTKEERLTELRLMEDKKTVFTQRILSVESSYRPFRNNKMPDDLVRVLLEGLVDAVVTHQKEQTLPSLEDVESGKKTADITTKLPPLGDEIYSTLYRGKQLSDNLRAYVKASGLLIIPDGQRGDGKGMMPSVKLQGPLAFYQPEGGKDEMPLVDLENVIVKRHFSLVTEIVIQTGVSGSASMSEFIPLRHVTKTGPPPTVHIWTEKRSGNKVITLLKNMEALGFNLDILCRAWRQRFSTSCSIFDPSVNMSNLKSGTKIPLEIHLQGNLASQLTGILTKDLGIPSKLIRSTK